MLKNKMIGRKIRNIIILLMVIVIMFGAYRNINKSRAEKVEQLKAVALDNYGYLEKELFKLEAKQIDDDWYEIELPEDINTKKINRIVKVTLEDYVPEEVVIENAVKENATTENEVTESATEETQITENTTPENTEPENTEPEAPVEETTPEAPAQEETTTPEEPIPEAPVEETTPEAPAQEETTTPEEPIPEAPAQEETTTPEESTPEAPAQEETTIPEEPIPEVSVQEETTLQPILIPENTTTENVTEGSNVLEIVENKIYLTKQQLEEKQINIEVVYDVLLLTQNPDKTFSKTPLVVKNAEEISKIVKTEGVQLVYNKILRYEDEKNGKLVELKGYLPFEAELQVEEVTIEKLQEGLQEKVVLTGEEPEKEELLEEPQFFTKENVEIAYDIKILNKIVEKTPVDEANPTAKPQEVINAIEINPGDYREACEVTIKDTKIGKNSDVYHIREDKGYEQVSIKDNSKEGNISFETYEFSTYVVVKGTENEMSFDDIIVNTTEVTSGTRTQPAYIPDGYRHVSGTTMANGYVIENINNGNQFVWVEVPADIYENTNYNTENTIADRKPTSIEDYDNIEYCLTKYTETYGEEIILDQFGVTDQYGFADVNAYNEQKYKMLKSILAYGGFYVGRYETGIENTPKTSGDETTEMPSETPVIKQSAYPYNFVTAKQAQTLASSEHFAVQGYETSLMFDVQWNLLLKYMETKAVEKGSAQSAVILELDRNSTNWGNYSDNNWTLDDDNAKYWTKASGWKTGKYNGGTKGNKTDSVLLSTGASSTFAKQNIYDVAGNVTEWILAKYNYEDISKEPVSKGGNFGGSSLGAGNYYLYNQGYLGSGVGFRVSLYQDYTPGTSTGPSTLKTTNKETTSASGFLGNTAIAREDIESVTFLNSTSGAPATGTWDVSEAGDRSIIAWYTGINPYQVYIASNVQIKANVDSSCLFANIGSGENCTATSVINNIHLLDTSDVTNMNYMFRRCGYNAMTTLDLGSNFDTSEVTNMNYMFQWCGYNAMTTLDLGDEFDTSKVTNMYAMFGDCGYGAMTSLNLGNKFNTCNVINMEAMFYLCGRSALTNINLGNYFDTSKVTSMYAMFYKFGTNGIVLNLGDKFDTRNVTNMRNMFSYSDFSSLDLGDKFDTSKVTNMYYMFYKTGMSSLETLDMGPLFTKIPDGTIQLSSGVSANAYDQFATDLGKEGCIIYCPNEIFENNHAFKLSVDSTTTIEYTRGIINPGNGGGDGEEPTPTPDTEKPVWNFVSAKHEETDGSAVIVISGTDNELLSTSSLKASDLTIWINSTKIDTSRITVGQAIQLGDGRGGVKYPITISNYTGGDVLIRIAAETLIDAAGNKSEQQDITIPSFYTEPIPETETDKPEIRYIYSDTDIDKDEKTLTVTFSIVDKNFKSSVLNVEHLSITIDGKDIKGKGVTKEFTKIEDKFATVDGKEKLIGIEYTLLISDIQKTFIDPEDLYANYSGVVNVTVPADVAEDESGNKNDKTTIIVGINRTGEDLNDKIVIGGGNGDSNTGSYGKPSDLYAEGKLQIGDFVDYDAGTWTQEEINEIKTGPTSSLVTANGSTSKPSSLYQFGGFAEGTSRNENAPATKTGYDYVNDASTNTSITGWRVFDISDDGKVTLISAGNPEDYYACGSEYIDSYILSGVIDSNWTAANSYAKRDWSHYENLTQNAVEGSATILTKNKLDDWYSKYLNLTNPNTYTSTTFQEIYNNTTYRKYLNIIDNYSEYWFSDIYNNGTTNYLYYMQPSNRKVNISSSSGIKGVRVLVTLENNVLFSSGSDETTKTLSGGNMDTYGGAQTYNVWGIKPKEAPKGYVKPSELFAEGKIQIGDFVDYDAGRWTQDEINNIKVGSTSALVTANGSTSLPSTAFQFGGFTAESSRNENSTQYGTSVDFIKDEEGNDVTGWRIFDITEDTVTLISAGNPESYYVGTGASDGFISEYILSGNVHANWNGANTSLYQKRDWGNYVNSAQNGATATVLTKGVLDEWYSKYIGAGNAPDTNTSTIFQRIYNKTYYSYQNIIDNNTFYWLSSNQSTGYIYALSHTSRRLILGTGTFAYGLRVLVTLDTDALFKEESIGTKTLSGGNMDSYGGAQTYNIWKLYDSNQPEEPEEPEQPNEPDSIENYAKPSELFAEGKLKIGDFINYDAGTWTEGEINSIKTGLKSNLVTANGSTDLPNKAFQFGGFTAGSSRNENATPDEVYGNYIKDEAGNAVTGWRVFDIDGDTITLISAGNPEDYASTEGTNYAYISEYILAGKDDNIGDTSLYQKRDWSDYVNSEQGGDSATVLSKNRLDAWYSKYIQANANTYTREIFEKIYSSPYLSYQNIVDNNSFYYFSDASNSGELNWIIPITRIVSYGAKVDGIGIRILVTLKPEVVLSKEKVGTKTLSGGNMDTYGGAQTYNVWNLGVAYDVEKEPQRVDVVDPLWTVYKVEQDKETGTVTITFDATDKFLRNTAVSLTDIVIKDTATGTRMSNLEKSLSGPKESKYFDENGERQLYRHRYVLTLSGFEEAARMQSKLYKEWSGEATLEIAANTAIDLDGNTNRDKAELALGIIDLIKPEYTYQYSESDINKKEKTVKVEFIVADKYFKESSLTSASQLTIKIDNEIPTWKDENGNTTGVKRTLTKKTLDAEVIDANGVIYKTNGDIYYDIDGTGTSVKIGEKYVLTLSELEQDAIETGKKYLDYSGIVTIGIPGGVATDYFDNVSGSQSITIGIDVLGDVYSGLPSTEYTTPYLPTGYKYVEGDLKTGLVIADELENEYVWVEVPRTLTVYPNAKLGITEFTNADYDAIETDLKTYTTTYRNNTKYTDTNHSQTGLTDERYLELKHKMLKSIYLNGGFYVGRYETGIADSEPDVIDDETLEARTEGGDTTQTPVIQANAYPYNFVTNAQAQDLASNFAKNIEGYESSLLFGIQWDLVLKNLETIGAATVEELYDNSLGWGNSGDSEWSIENNSAMYSSDAGASWNDGVNMTNSGDIILSTGASTQFERGGIYDLFGNVGERTLEYTSNSSHPCAIMGGQSNGFGEYAVWERSWAGVTEDAYYGFRVALYADGLAPSNNNSSGSSSTGTKPSNLFDAEGTDETKLHIGDFVNYDAGTWTEEEINAIQTGFHLMPETANNSTSLPTNGCQFGGFTAGSSRNGNATPNTEGGCDYIKRDGTDITGWRVFDINGNTVTLISAGNPEDYYQIVGSESYASAYISEYILTGNVNEEWDETNPSIYITRDWSDYKNTSQYATSATLLTKSRLDEWYSKYTSAGSGANTHDSYIFQLIYDVDKKLQTVVDNYSYYWLANSYSSTNMYCIYPNNRTDM